MDKKETIREYEENKKILKKEMGWYYCILLEVGLVGCIFALANQWIAIAITLVAFTKVFEIGLTTERYLREKLDL